MRPALPPGHPRWLAIAARVLRILLAAGLFAGLFAMDPGTRPAGRSAPAASSRG